MGHELSDCCDISVFKRTYNNVSECAGRRVNVHSASRLDAVLRAGQVTISAEEAQLIWEYVRRKSRFNFHCPPGGPTDLTSKLKGFADYCKRSNAERLKESTRISEWFSLFGPKASEPQNQNNEHCRRYIEKLFVHLDLEPRTHPSPQDVFNDPEWEDIFHGMMYHMS